MIKPHAVSPFILSTFLGFICLVPIIIFELINRWRFHESFPFAMFSFAWILQALFLFILIPIIRTIRSGKSFTQSPIMIVLRLLGLVLIAYIWVGWVIDQWPCLIGVPNCD